MKEFAISSSVDQSSWKLLLTQTLTDPRGLGCDIPLVALNIPVPNAIGTYLELKPLSYYGATYALRFFAVDFVSI